MVGAAGDVCVLRVESRFGEDSREDPRELLRGSKDSMNLDADVDHPPFVCPTIFGTNKYTLLECYDNIYLPGRIPCNNIHSMMRQKS